MSKKKQSNQFNFSEFESESSEVKNSNDLFSESNVSISNEDVDGGMSISNAENCDKPINENDFNIDVFATVLDVVDSDSLEDKDIFNSDDESPFYETPAISNADNIHQQASIPVKNKEKKESPIIQNTEIVSSNNTIIDTYNLRINPLLEKAGMVVLIQDDEDNNEARSIAKEMSNLKSEVDKTKKALNKPLKKQMDENNEKAKRVIEPLENGINRIKLLITTYELEKDRKRKEELKRLEEEKRKKEIEAEAERLRVDKIKQEVQRLRLNAINSVNNATTINGLETIKNSLTSWKPKRDFFMELYNDVDVVLRNEIITLINGRLPIVKQLEESMIKARELEKINKEEAEKKKKEAQVLLMKEQESKQKEEALRRVKEENQEMQYKNELVVLVASLGIRDVESFINKIHLKYGNYQKSIDNRDKIISDYTKEQEEEKIQKQLEQDKIKNQRTDYLFEVTDKNIVPTEYLCIDEAKIKKAIQENRTKLEKDINSFKISGIVIKSKTQTILRN